MKFCPIEAEFFSCG